MWATRGQFKGKFKFYKCSLFALLWKAKTTKPAKLLALRVLKFGRHKQTRTADPHHVKVVL